MSVFDYFIGSQQSKYAGVAIMTTIFFCCLAILFTNTDVPFLNKLGLVGFILLILIFPVAMSLFELTCIVTGGKGRKFNLCNYYGWFITILVIIYCFIRILVILSSMFTYRKAYDKMVLTESFTKMSADDANTVAQEMMTGSDKESENNAPANAASVGSLLPVSQEAQQAQQAQMPQQQQQPQQAQPMTQPQRQQQQQGNSPTAFSVVDKFMPF